MPTPETAKFTANDALIIANQLGGLAALAFPATAATIALYTGLATLLRDTLVPVIQHLKAHELSIVEQAALALEDAADRIRVGASPSPGN